MTAVQPEIASVAAAADSPLVPAVAAEAPKKRRPRTPQGPQYRALKKITVGEKTFKPGQLVPGAAGWLRVEAWVRSRHLELVE